jgi:hypothetical protein
VEMQEQQKTKAIIKFEELMVMVILLEKLLALQELPLLKLVLPI